MLSHLSLYCYYFFPFNICSNDICGASFVESQTSHRRITDDYRRVTDESQTTSENYRRVTDELQTTTDKSQVTTDEPQTSHRRVTDELQIQITPKVFSDTFIKHYFQKGYGFQTRWFLLKGGKSRTWCLLKCWKLFLTINQTMLSF